MMTIDKAQIYAQLHQRILAVTAGEHDEIANMATIACEIYHGLDYVDWAGFYRVVAPSLLKVGPYQGGHGCLTIPFGKGVCGQCAASEQAQLVDNVNDLANHIACSASTQSEIVLPVYNAQERLIGVLDLDSDQLAAFDQQDDVWLTRIVRDVFFSQQS